MDQSLWAAKACGMLSDEPAGWLVGGTGCGLPNTGFQSGLAPLALSGRSGIRGNLAVTLLLEESLCPLTEN
jgi:hypothetical protein